jgi:hypothetical protein
VRVIRHHDCHIKIVFGLMSVNTTVEHDRSSPIRQNPAMSCSKRDEVRFVITLEMRQIAPVERHLLILDDSSAGSTQKLLHQSKSEQPM